MAPTRLGSFGPRNYANKAYSNTILDQAAEPATAFLTPPWPGFEPDLDPKNATSGAAKSCFNLIDREGTLSLDDGYARVDPSDLPLDSGNPVVGIGFGFDRNTSYPGPIRRLIVTTTKLYELNAGAWTARAYTNTVAGSSAFNLGATNLCDMIYFPAGNYSVICTGPDHNDVMRYPEVSAGTQYTEAFNVVAIGHFRAQSVTVHGDRLLFLNTNEAGSSFRTRLRWTNEGAAATIDETVTGTGFGDFNEFYGIGLRVVPIGQKVAMYFEDGVQFLVRTGHASDAYTRDYGTHERGLMSTHSIASVGSGIHFGIFTDGWFLVTADGGWTELGTASVDKSSTYYKWKDTFYGQLNMEQRSIVTIAYDPTSKTILIAWPSGSSTVCNNLWRYDLVSDRLWPQTVAKYPNVLGRFQEQLTAGTSWAQATFPWSSAIQSWDSFSGFRGAERLVSGTADGIVYQYTNPANSRLRDGQQPSWSYQTHAYDAGTPHLHKRMNRLYLGYNRAAATVGTILATVTSNTGESIQGTISPTKGITSSRQTDFVSGQASGQQFATSLSGSGDVAITRVGFEIIPEDAKVFRKGVGT